jgi:hypothetical protein
MAILVHTQAHTTWLHMFTMALRAGIAHISAFAFTVIKLWPILKNLCYMVILAQKEVWSHKSFCFWSSGSGAHGLTHARPTPYHWATPLAEETNIKTLFHGVILCMNAKLIPESKLKWVFSKLLTLGFPV